ncbi:hypothetical protein BO99DRAFT_131030 [Aspergillus violaceofuscus CBS 115571]|uniref:Uncharacterized protein n=1 Tax=Aspergillus violaceofuscus (strain CBS 115571) TaxID=1450538 RepID=A0A2V5HBV9_ASPV1|nr:hypothetical protein BO99DRAFT_131030 [Aspergillus violaceofuscus CBS 115571]
MRTSGGALGRSAAAFTVDCSVCEHPFLSPHCHVYFGRRACFSACLFVYTLIPCDNYIPHPLTTTNYHQPLPPIPRILCNKENSTISHTPSHSKFSNTPSGQVSCNQRITYPSSQHLT